MNTMPPAGSNTHFILDEAASLGHLEAIDDAVDKYRGYGVRLQFYFQSLGQLKKCFPEGQEQTLLSNACQIFFGINDNATADYVSARLGEETIIVKSGGTSRGGSYQTGQGGHSQSSTNYSENSNWQQQARKLLKPEEILVLPPRFAITFAPGMRPICTTLLRYYEEPRLFREPGRLGRCFRTVYWFVLALLWFLWAAMLAVALTATVNEHQTRTHERNILPPANRRVYSQR
jgi:type IV secretion system protein VirD4